MKNLSILALTLSATVAIAPAFAETTSHYNISNPSNQQADLSFAFGNVENLQAADMTLAQMQETEGAVAPLIFTPAILGGARVLLTGYTRHGINQAISRNGVGVSNRAILNTMRNPTKVRHDPVRQTTSFHSRGGGVVLNQQGQVVTTWGKPRR